MGFIQCVSYITAHEPLLIPAFIFSSFRCVSWEVIYGLFSGSENLHILNTRADRDINHHGLQRDGARSSDRLTCLHWHHVVCGVNYNHFMFTSCSHSCLLLNHSRSYRMRYTDNALFYLFILFWVCFHILCTRKLSISRGLSKE